MLMSGNITYAILGRPKGDDPTEIMRGALVGGATSVPPDVRVDPAPAVEISLSDREKPMTVYDFRDIAREVSTIIDHFRPIIG